MENNTDKPVLSEQDERVTEVPSGRRSPWVNIGIFIAACAVIVLVLVVDLTYKRLMTVNKQLSSQTTTLKTEFGQDQATLADMQKTIDSLSQTVQSTLAAQQQAIGEIRNATTGKQESFNVSEAAYLTNLANDNLQLGDNISQVIRLLQTADQRLKDMSDANVLPLRKALAADLAALQAVPVVDVAGIYAELTALNGEVDKLPLPNNRPQAAATATATDDNALPWWRRGLQQSLAALQKIVIVRYTQPGVRPFIPPEQQDFLYQNLHANFAEALTALVQRQPDIYRESLKQATGWIQRYFLTDSPVTVAMTTALTRLQAVTLRPALPTVSASLQAFHDYYMQGNAADKASAATPTQS